MIKALGEEQGPQSRRELVRGVRGAHRARTSKVSGPSMQSLGSHDKDFGVHYKCNEWLGGVKVYIY